MQDTPATVRVPRAQALSAGPVLLTRLDGHLGDLESKANVLLLRLAALRDGRTNCTNELQAHGVGDVTPALNTGR